MDSFICGGLSACCAILAVNPADVIKSRMQVAQETLSKSALAASSPPRYTSFTSSFIDIWHGEGLRGLYRGLGPALCFQYVGNSVRFGVFHSLKKAINPSGSPSGMSGTINLLCASIAGVCAGVAACPFFVLKTQFQIRSSDPNIAAGYQQEYAPGFRPAVAAIYKAGGWKGFFRGADAFIPRVIVLVATQLTTYEAAKRRISEAGVEGFALHAASAAGAAAAATTAMQPLDLLSSRLMNQPVNAWGRGAYYSGVTDCFRKTWAEGGVRALYRGGVANYLRMCPQYILTFVFFEHFKRTYSILFDK